MSIVESQSESLYIENISNQSYKVSTLYSRIWKHLRFLWSNICIICQFIIWLTAYCPKKGNFNRKYAAEVIIKLKESCIHSIEKLKILLQEQYNSRPVNHWILLRKKVSGERYTEKGFLLKLIICRWRWRRLQTTSKWSSCFTRRWGEIDNATHL